MDFNKLHLDLTSEEYHSMGGTFSSSQLKTMLEDPEIFYKKYITKEVAKEENAAFDTGTYFHTSLLEPHKLAEECIVFPGAIRRGKEWEAFKELHKGKAILTKTDKEVGDKLVAAVKDSPIAMKLLEHSKAEISAFLKIYVLGKDVFAFRNDECFCLMPVGWVPTSGDYEPEDIREFGVELVLKVRADALGMGTGIISDLKSTTGNAKKAFEMQSKVSAYQYDLSAALYLDIFTMVSGEEYHTFVWIFASKDVGNCKSYKASHKNIMVGRAKWKYAVVELAKYIQNDWQFFDELGELEPPHFALDWLTKE